MNLASRAVLFLIMVLGFGLTSCQSTQDHIRENPYSTGGAVIGGIAGNAIAHNNNAGYFTTALYTGGVSLVAGEVIALCIGEEGPITYLASEIGGLFSSDDDGYLSREELSAFLAGADPITGMKPTCQFYADGSVFQSRHAYWVRATGERQDLVHEYSHPDPGTKAHCVRHYLIPVP